MTTHRRPASVVRLLTAAAVAVCLFSDPSTSAETLYPTGYVYRDIDGERLPFQDHATILEVLRTAPIVDSELMQRGVAGNYRLVLRHGDLRIRAVMRIIEQEEKVKTASSRITLEYRDSQQFETAAYELDRLLGIGRIPPTASRRFQGQDGSIQIWMEGVQPEDLLVEDGELNPPDRRSWVRQKAIMRVFDALIANTDRNQGNLLIDDDWNIFFIDHTRAFRETSELIDVELLETCERSLWEAIKSVDVQVMLSRVEPYLTSGELKKLELRHKRLVRYFEKRIKKHGEDAVLFDLVPPAPTPAK
jgi:hypothetical protein